MYQRNIEENIRTILSDTPVVILNGARQTGKSTLAARLAAELRMLYYTLDDATTLSAANADPVGFIRGLDTPAVIDEVQKAPGLFPAIKTSVDADRKSGRFLLTGSANVMLLPRLSESLAGRMEIVTLWPLSQGELNGHRERFVERIFSPSLARLKDQGPPHDDIVRQVVTGGYPEVVRRKSDRRKASWCESYITAILQRDVRDFAHIEGLTELPRLLRLLAVRIGGLLNMAEISRSSGIPHSTLKRYLALLEATFLLQLLPAWSNNLGKRLTKSPKIHLLDSGLSSYLAGQTVQRFAQDSNSAGHALECFVAGEIRKQLSWAQIPVKMYYFRTATGREVDIVLEDHEGRIVGIEVKAAATVHKQDFFGLEALAEAAGKRFVRGIVLYNGTTVVPFGKNYHALPVSALWRTV